MQYLPDDEPELGAGTKAAIWGLIALAVSSVAFAVGTGMYIILTIIENRPHG